MNLDGATVRENKNQLEKTLARRPVSKNGSSTPLLLDNTNI